MMKINNRVIYFILVLYFITSFFLFIPQNTFAKENVEKIEKKIDAYLEEHEDSLSGVVVIVRDGHQMIVKTSGYADVERGVKIDEDTVFEWGSISKLLVWISVMQLAEEGLVDLETDISEYLPEDFHLPKSFDAPITLLHVMNHTAGFDDSYTDLMLVEPDEIVHLKEALEQADIKQVYSPGEIVAYSNYGSALAAFIVEEVSGLDYREYVKENILIPLEMDQTSIDPEQKDNEWVKKQRKKIQGYTEEKELIDPNLYRIPLYPAGSVMSTPADMTKFMNAFLSEDGSPLFKQKKTIDSMFQPTVYYPETEIPRIAHGLFFLPSEGKVYGHGGNTLAFSSSLYVDRDNHSAVAVMTNQRNESIFCLGIPELVFGRMKDLGNEEKLEKASVWEGLYQPARMPYHGFSKLYGVLHRSTVKQTNTYDLMTNDLYYTQQRPGVYLTEDDYSIYSLDIYSSHPTYGKILSATFNDLIPISMYQHVIELVLLITCVIAIVFSFLFIFVRAFRAILKKKGTKSSKLITFLNTVNVLFVINVSWIFYKALSMTSYQTLKPFFLVNIIYLVVTIGLSGYSLLKGRKASLSRKQKSIYLFTIIFSLILCVNVLYWELYH